VVDLTNAVKGTEHEFHGLGIDMGQRYMSKAIYLEDAGPPPSVPEDPVFEYHPSIYPGCRLPHAWLSKAKTAERVSTLDIYGNANFTLLTGLDGDDWKQAEVTVSAELGVAIEAFSIGFRQE
jgi:hypothetical protein